MGQLNRESDRDLRCWCMRIVLTSIARYSGVRSRTPQSRGSVCTPRRRRVCARPGELLRSHPGASCGVTSSGTAARSSGRAAPQRRSERRGCTRRSRRRRDRGRADRVLGRSAEPCPVRVVVSRLDYCQDVVDSSRISRTLFSSSHCLNSSSLPAKRFGKSTWMNVHVGVVPSTMAATRRCPSRRGRTASARHHQRVCPRWQRKRVSRRTLLRLASPSILAHECVRL